MLDEFKVMDDKLVVSIDFEPIVKSDGQSKYCCERNSAKRLIPSLAKQYPKRQLIIVEDALAANGPHIQCLTVHGMDYVIGVKPKGNPKRFDAFAQRRHGAESESVVEFEHTDPHSGVTRGCRFSND
jgi:hypothetical protein